MQSAVKRNLLWWGSGLLAVVILSVSASFTPTIMKRLLLFHTIFGVACGMVLLWLAEEIRPAWRRSLPWWGGFLCMLGCLNMGWLSFQHFQKARAEFAAANPRDAALQSMLEKLSEDDPELKARYEEEKRRTEPWFEDYLAHRLGNLGNWKRPWPALFWTGEILLAATACGAVIRWKSRAF